MKTRLPYIVWGILFLAATFALFSSIRYREAESDAERSLRELSLIGDYAKVIKQHRSVVDDAVNEEQLSKDLVYDLLQASGISESSVSSIQSSDQRFGNSRYHSFESTVVLQGVGLVQISQLIASAENHHASVRVEDVSITRSNDGRAWVAVVKLAQQYTKDG